jgi:hypothetical protein
MTKRKVVQRDLIDLLLVDYKNRTACSDPALNKMREQMFSETMGLEREWERKPEQVPKQVRG